MSDIYKEKEWEVRKKIEETPNIPSVFENYVKEVDKFIDYQIKDVIKERDENYLLKQKLEAVKNEIKKIINEIEDNPRTNAELRDKYNIQKLKGILEILDKGE
ncbi:MAG: hypothetical protein IJI98_11125 [Methanosphaera sp.]|nr:hypothetical protein [Methanobrevibacter sp.]MBQ6754210.1 hypothetical protein [Bacteroidales bacterium]MBR0351347.1 hypothetical protein [Clostridia bacterium]MBR0473231.1 hypothetical protein [Methanosphaera sp.]